MARLDTPVWELGPAGGVGPPGWLGSAASASVYTLYTPLHDYHLTPPDLAPGVADRVRTISGRTAILSETSIEDHTNILTSPKVRFCSDEEWLAVVGRSTEGSDSVLQLFCPFFDDRRIAEFAFWWASAAGMEDTVLGDAVWFVSNHILALSGYLGMLTLSDDEAVVTRYTETLPVFSTPWDVLVDLGREAMVAP